MSDFSRLLTNPPPEQEAIRAKCFHPGGVLPDFPKDEVESSIPERFETIVRRHPDRPAVKVGNQVLTYALINDMANRIARSILRRRSEQSEPIALMFRKGAEQIAAMLGVLKAGKILVVVDPLFPEKRIRTMICDSQAPWLVCDAQSIGLAQCVAGSACDVVEFAMLDQDITGVDLPLQMSPAAFACLIYSSGSTGQPKGIIQNHRNILHTTWIRVHDSNACYNDRVADLFFSGLKQPGIVPEYVAGIPELDAVAEEFYDGLAGMIAIVLMDQQVDSRFAEHAKPRGIVSAAEGNRINIFKRFGHKELVLTDQLIPGLDDVLFAYNSVNPASLGHGLVGGIA